VLLDGCESGAISTPGILRFWEPTSCFIVLGYANRVAQEVISHKLPVFRRCSGGGSVLQAPGCLNYSLILAIGGNADFESVTRTNCFIMKTNAEALSGLVSEPVKVDGYTDLTWKGKKVSGNSQRRKHNWILFHGSFLLDANFQLMEEVLAHPLKQPPYRKNRAHSDFLTRLPCTADDIKTALARTWHADTAFHAIPTIQVKELARQKYANGAWNLKW